MVVDSLYKKPIQQVEIYTENGKLIGTTDKEGKITEDSVEEIKRRNTQSLFFYKIGFKEIKLSVTDIMLKDTIHLSEITTPIELEEVILSAEKTVPKYLKITTYFRSIQFSDSQPQYYMDGIAEYYIKTKNSRIKAKIIQNRSYKDKSIKRIDEKGLVRLNFNIVGIPYIDDYINKEQLMEEYNIKKDEEQELILSQKNTILGKYLEEGTENILEIQIYSKENPKVMRAFGSESILDNYYINATYNHNDSFSSLKSFKESRSYKIKQKKESTYTQINAVNELYVLSKEFVNDMKGAKSNSYYEFISKSNYKTDYWEMIDDRDIPLLPGVVQKFINDNLYKL
ncbi:hypothetical protein OOZ15_18505 [Galbibacter sp. EGI 63066]|uniref:hypothetical protein n=1 Tax=Galbibacter sp. EGI 63066 TaxID=2993559 RepID=UPI00224926AB|nr:hypothetical protein [Galbibacter sp. EGI 63066]MCX2681949.1 hypothetical protein [Galbibacter sp. EGI 63066]